MFDSNQAGWIVITWMSVIGAVIGSFLNVVVYRLPLGMSLVDPPSHCPKCKHPIRWFDNVPVLGWFLRWGRCRDCGSAISIRYPIVEAITALFFGLMTAYEFLTFGKNLPPRMVIVGGVGQTGLSWQEAFAATLFHLLLLCTLLCAALMEIDGQRPPLKLFLPALLVGFFGPLGWPMLRPVSAWWLMLRPLSGWWPRLGSMSTLPSKPYLLMGAVDGLIGLAAGAAIGGLLCSLTRWAGTVPIFAATKLRMVAGHKNGTVPFRPRRACFGRCRAWGCFLVGRRRWRWPPRRWPFPR